MVEAEADYLDFDEEEKEVTKNKETNAVKGG